MSEAKGKPDNRSLEEKILAGLCEDPSRLDKYDLDASMFSPGLPRRAFLAIKQIWAGRKPN